MLSDSRHKLWKILADKHGITLTSTQLHELVKDVKECLIEEQFIEAINTVHSNILYSRCTCGLNNVELCPVNCNNR